MQELDQILSDATATIGATYFLLPIQGGPAIYRERVYCYELYPQMRSRWPDECPYSLNGEVDKGGHPLLRELGVGAAKPDLLVHGPGDMALNHAVIEVKPHRPTDEQIMNDLEKLATFVLAVGYRRAIYLIYGDQARQAAVRVEALLGRLPMRPPIEVWIHEGVGRRAERAFAV